MATLRFTQAARADLLAIWAFIAVDSPISADRVFDRIEKACGPLRIFPKAGRARPEIAPDARSISVERWLILYRLTEAGAQVVRIVDGARDLNKLDWPSD